MSSEALVVERMADRLVADRRQASAEEIGRVLDAALAETIARSPEDPRVGDIAKRAGISTQTLYRLFETKEELFVALQQRISEQSIPYLVRAMARESEPADKVAAWVRSSVSWTSSAQASHAARPVLVQVSRIAPQRLVAGGEGDYESRPRRLLLQPLVDCGSRDPESHAMFISDTVFGVTRRCLWAGSVPTRAEIERVCAFCVGGVLHEVTTGR